VWKTERGVEREVNVGERGRCRRDRGEIVGTMCMLTWLPWI
jgi:hypothetical protein